MHIIKHLLILTLLCCLPIQIYAGGVILYEISSADTRLASAGWSARANDPSTLFSNPAGMSRLCGKQAEIGAQAIFIHANFDSDSETTIEGRNGDADIWLPSGSFFYIHPCNEKLTVGIGSLGYFGSDLVYPHEWVGRYYTQKTLLEGLSLVPAAAYRINEHWSIGAGLNVMYGFFKQRTGVNNFLDRLSDGYFNLHDYRFGYGGLFGILYEPTACTRMGIQYLTPVKLDFHAKPKFHNLGPILEDILTDVGVIGSKLNLHVNVPQGLMFSIYHDINCCWSIMGNAGWQQWSNFQQVTVSLEDLNQRSITSKIKFKDTWHTALGLEWRAFSNLTLSGGIAYDSSAVSDSERPLNFPIGKQWRFGTGARWLVSQNLIIDFSAELQWQGNLKADVNKGLITGHVAGVFKDTYAVFMNANVSLAF